MNLTAIQLLAPPEKQESSQRLARLFSFACRNMLGVREAHIGLDRLGLGLAAPGGLAEDIAIVLDSLVNAFLGGKPHLDQFEECNTSLRDGPRGHQGG